MPTAKSTAKNSAVLPNSAPINTINVDIPTNRAKVFNLLACGCQVISVLLRTLVYSSLQPIERPGGPSGSRDPPQSALAVPADRVVAQRPQRLAAGDVGHKAPLLAC